MKNKTNQLQINPQGIKIIKNPSPIFLTNIRKISKDRNALYAFLTIVLCCDDEGKLKIRGDNPDRVIFQFVKKNRSLLDSLIRELYYKLFN